MKTQEIFPIEIKTEQAAIDRDFVAVSFLGTKDPNYHFEMLVPKRCQIVAPNGTSNIGRWYSIPIALCNSEPGPGLQIKVDVLQLFREASPADLVETQIEQMQAEILARRSAYGAGGEIIDALMKIVYSAGFLIRRTMTVKDGSRVFLITAEVTESAYSAVAEEILISLQSFRLLNPDGAATAETLIKHCQPMPIGFHFDHPKSWQITEAFSDQDHCVLNLNTEFEGNCAGRIIIEVHRPDTTRSAINTIERYANELQQMGIRHNGAPVIPIQPTPNFTRAWAYAPTTTFQEQPIDAPALVLEHPLALALIGLIGPSRQTSPEWWAINKRTFEIVRDSLKIGDALS